MRSGDGRTVSEWQPRVSKDVRQQIAYESQHGHDLGSRLGAAVDTARGGLPSAARV